MGNLFSRESTTDSFEKALDKIDASIRAEHILLADAKSREHIQKRAATYYALALWGLLVAVAFSVNLHSVPDNWGDDLDASTSVADSALLAQDAHLYAAANRWKTDSVRFLAVLFGPILLLWLRRVVTWWYERARDTAAARLDSLKAQQRAKIEELKKITAFYRAKELIERYEHLLDDESQPGTNAPPNTAFPGSPQQQHGMFPGSGAPFIKTDPRFLQQNPQVRSISSPALRLAAGPSNPSAAAAGPMSPRGRTEGDDAPTSQPLAIEAPPPSSAASAADQGSSNGGWLGKLVERAVLGDGSSNGNGNGDRDIAAQDPPGTVRIAAAELDLLRRFALICGMCHTHNGLAHPAEFANIKFVCRMCATLNDREAKAAGAPWLFQKMVPDAPLPPDVIAPPQPSSLADPFDPSAVPLPPSPFVRPTTPPMVVGFMPGAGPVPPVPVIPAPFSATAAPAPASAPNTAAPAADVSGSDQSQASASTAPATGADATDEGWNLVETDAVASEKTPAAATRERSLSPKRSPSPVPAPPATAVTE